MIITFNKISNGYKTQLNDTEVQVSYDSLSWHLHWLIYTAINQCEEEHICAKLDVDLDDLEEKDMAEDEYCHDCPRTMVRMTDQDSYTSDNWNENPQTLEEARQLILERYQQTAHNGLYHRNPNFCNIMFGTWQLG